MYFTIFSSGNKDISKLKEREESVRDAWIDEIICGMFAWFICAIRKPVLRYIYKTDCSITEYWLFPLNQRQTVEQ